MDSRDKSDGTKPVFMKSLARTKPYSNLQDCPTEILTKINRLIWQTIPLPVKSITNCQRFSKSWKCSVCHWVAQGSNAVPAALAAPSRWALLAGNMSSGHKDRLSAMSAQFTLTKKLCGEKGENNCILIHTPGPVLMLSPFTWLYFPHLKNVTTVPLFQEK